MLEALLLPIALLPLAAGVVLVVRSQAPAAHPQCRGCGYDRRGLAPHRVCPECGGAAAIACGEPRIDSDVLHWGIVLLVAGTSSVPVALEAARAIPILLAGN